MNYLRIIALLTFLLLVSADQHNKKKAGEPSLHQKHYDADGHHNAEYDGESVLGEDAEQFKELDEREKREKLAKYVNEMDVDKDGNVSHEELQNRIVESYKKIDHADIIHSITDHDEDNDQKLNWSEVLKLTYGYTQEELDKQIADQEKDGLLVAASLPYDKKKFDAADANKDGALDADELLLFAHPQNSEIIREIEANKIMNESDKDKDGKLSLKEYLQEFGATSSRPDEQQSEDEHFKQADQNSDGYLDLKELMDWSVPTYASTADGEVGHLFQEADSNGNNLLSMDEIQDQAELFTGSHAAKGHDEL